MKWTNEKPTESGLYLWRETEGLTPYKEVARVACHPEGILVHFNEDCLINGVDMELAPRHECKPNKKEDEFNGYECVVIDSQTKAVVRRVCATDKMNAIKLEILFNVDKSAGKYIAEARFEGCLIK